MRFVDTNIIVRYLVQDDAAMAAACRALFERAAQGDEDLATSESVVAEVVYVLSSRRLYGLSRPEIRIRLVPILTLPALWVRDRSVLLRALDLFVVHPIDFEDALTVAHMERDGMTELLTYDRDFDRIPGIRRSEPSPPSV